MFPVAQIIQAYLPGPAGQLIGSILQSAINRGQSVSVFNTPWGGVSYSVGGPGGGYGGYFQQVNGSYGAYGGYAATGYSSGFPSSMMPFARPVLIPGLGIGYFFGPGVGGANWQTGNPYTGATAGVTQSQPSTVSGPDAPTSASPSSPTTTDLAPGVDLNPNVSDSTFEKNVMAAAGKVDSMMAEAESLMGSGDQKSMMKAQMLMQKATQLLTFLTNIMEARHKAMMNIINNIRPA